jgi:hypothetical protein
MKIFNALLLLITAGLISTIAAYMSIYGMLALFPTGGLIIALMMGFLEFGKLVNAAWIHSNWRSTNVSRLHKTYLVAAVASLMVITSMGIYGFLAKSHLEQTGPEGNIQVQIDQKNQEMAPLISQRDQLLKEQQSSNAVINGLLQSNQAKGAGKFLKGQQSANSGLQAKIDAVDAQINQKNTELVPLKLKVNEVESKLGPMKYVGKLFGFKDSENAVQMVIVILIFVFDPLAVVMLISGTITWHEFLEERRNKKSTATLNQYVVPTQINPEVTSTPIEEPFWKTLGFESEKDKHEYEEKLRGSKVAPEIVPEIVPEVIPEIVPEVIPEIVPEVIPEIVPEVIPEVVIEPVAPKPLWNAGRSVASEVPETRIVDYGPVSTKTDDRKYATLQTEAELEEKKNPVDLRDQLVALLEKNPALLADIMAAIDEAKTARESI